MYTQEITVNNEVGLHARPATFFIQKANEFKSGIWVEKDDRRVNAKSLLGVLSLGIVKGTTITLIADGTDEKGSGEGQLRRIRNETGSASASRRRCSFVLIKSLQRGAEQTRKSLQARVNERLADQIHKNKETHSFCSNTQITEQAYLLQSLLQNMAKAFHTVLGSQADGPVLEGPQL